MFGMKDNVATSNNLTERELIILRREKEQELHKWEIDKSFEVANEIEARKLRNWQLLDKVREERADKVIAIQTEIVKLEAKREYNEYVVALKIEAFEALMKSKDDEIKRLSDLLASAITALGAKKAK